MQKEVKVGLTVVLGFLFGLILGNVMLGVILGTCFGLVWGYSDQMLTHKTHKVASSRKSAPRKTSKKSRRKK